MLNLQQAYPPALQQNFQNSQKHSSVPPPHLTRGKPLPGDDLFYANSNWLETSTASGVPALVCLRCLRDARPSKSLYFPFPGKPIFSFRFFLEKAKVILSSSSFFPNDGFLNEGRHQRKTTARYLVASPKRFYCCNYSTALPMRAVAPVFRVSAAWLSVGDVAA